MNARTFEISPLPKMEAFALMSSKKEMAKYILDGGNISFKASLVSKTMLNTSFSGGEHAFNINFEIDGIKTIEKSQYSYFTSTTTTNHYFKISKKQNKEQYIEYVKHLVDQVEKILGVKITQNNFLIHTTAFPV